MTNRRVSKRKAVSRSVLSYRVHKQTNRPTNNKFYLRQSTGLANRPANQPQFYFKIILLPIIKLPPTRLKRYLKSKDRWIFLRVSMPKSSKEYLMLYSYAWISRTHLQRVLLIKEVTSASRTFPEITFSYVKKDKLDVLRHGGRG